MPAGFIIVGVVGVIGVVGVGVVGVVGFGLLLDVAGVVMGVVGVIADGCMVWIGAVTDGCGAPIPFAAESSPPLEHACRQPLAHSITALQRIELA
jgi:hypothetical protein